MVNYYYSLETRIIVIESKDVLLNKESAMKSAVFAVTSIVFFCSGCFHYSVIKDHRQPAIGATYRTLNFFGFGHHPDPIELVNARQQMLLQTRKEMILDDLQKTADTEEINRLNNLLKAVESEIQNSPIIYGGLLINDFGQPAEVEIFQADSNELIGSVRIWAYSRKRHRLPEGKYTFVWSVGPSRVSVTKWVGRDWFCRLRSF